MSCMHTLGFPVEVACFRWIEGLHRWDHGWTYVLDSSAAVIVDVVVVVVVVGSLITYPQVFPEWGGVSVAFSFMCFCSIMVDPVFFFTIMSTSATHFSSYACSIYIDLPVAVLYVYTRRITHYYYYNYYHNYRYAFIYIKTVLLTLHSAQWYIYNYYYYYYIIHLKYKLRPPARIYPSRSPESRAEKKVSIISNAPVS